MLNLGVNFQSKYIFTRGFPAGNPVGRLTSHDTLYKRWQSLEKKHGKEKQSLYRNKFRRIHCR